MEAPVDTLCLLAQQKEGQQQIKKPKNNQNWQKIKLYGSPTTKDLKKKHSSRVEGGAETGSRAERTWGKAVLEDPGGQGCGWRARRWMADLARQRIANWAVPHSSADKLGGRTGEQDRPWNPGFQLGEIKLQTSDWKHLWGLRWQWEKLPASQESSLERPTDS